MDIEKRLEAIEKRLVRLENPDNDYEVVEDIELDLDIARSGH